METRYARVGDAHIAYRVLGDGPVDLLLFPSEYIPVDAIEEEPRLARAMRRLSSMARVVVFNTRGTGLSDPSPEVSWEIVLEDMRAAAEAAGVEKPFVFGSNVGGAPAILYTTRHQDETSGLILVNATPRYVNADDYSAGTPAEAFSMVAEQTTSTERAEVEFDFLRAFAPSVADDARFRSWWEQAGHRGQSPSRAKKAWDLLITTDVRSELDLIHVPTLVIARAAFRRSGQYVAERVTGARYVELAGADLMWWIGDADAILDEIEAFLGQAGRRSRPQRKLATAVFVDVVSSTETAVALGDKRWRDVITTYHELAERELSRAGGTRVNTAGDGFLALFDMPADAITCARRIADGVRALDIDVRAGVHTGEIEVVGDDVAGIGVHIAARVKEAAGPGEVYVSRTVTDLVAGSGIAFADRGEHDLKGVPGRWQLFAVC